MAAATKVTQSAPKVSIGMPVYNGERFLRQAIESILAQTFADFELIISDNASTDATCEICRAYAARDARIRYIAHCVNRGAAWNVNHVVTLARAPLFTWAHADDARAPRHLECCIAESDQAPASVVVTCTRSAVIDEHDRTTYLYDDHMDFRQPHPSERLRSAVRNDGWCNVEFGLIRTSVLRACRPLGGYPYSDLPLMYELALRGQFREVREHLFYRREHSNTSTRPGVNLMDTAMWLDPRNRGVLILPRWQSLLDTIRVIGAVGLPCSESWRCRMALLRGWPARYRREMGTEIRCAARTWLRLRIDRRWGEGRARELKVAARRWWRWIRGKDGNLSSSGWRHRRPFGPGSDADGE
jgi:hypothetical protein